MEEQKPIKETIQAIAFEVRESGATEWEVLKIIKELEGFAGSEIQLRKKSAEILEKLNPAAAKTFKSFEKMRVFTSAERREPFDRGNMIKSLLKETSISRHVAEKIGAEVEDRIKDIKLHELNTQIIREMVNVKLLEYGHESTHNEYARIGMPVFEVKKKLENGFFENAEILREYNWLCVIPRSAKELHFDGIIHIYNAQDYSTKTFCETKFLRAEKTDVALEAFREDKKLSIPLGLCALNHSVEKLEKSKKKLSAECDALAKVFEITGKKRIAELALFSDYEWRSAESKSTYLNFANALYKNKNASKQFEFVFSVDNKYKLKLIEKTANVITVLNNSKERNTINSEGVFCSDTKGINQLTAINLWKILEHSEEQSGFFEKLEDVLVKIKEMCDKKRAELKKRNYFTKEEAEQKSDAVCLAGLLRSAKTLNESNPAKSAEGIISAAQKSDFTVLEMKGQTALGIVEDRNEMQELLQKISQKQKKSYGFIYSANSIKEAEEKLSDCPCVRVPAQNDKA